MLPVCRKNNDHPWVLSIAAAMILGSAFIAQQAVAQEQSLLPMSPAIPTAATTATTTTTTIPTTTTIVTTTTIPIITTTTTIPIVTAPTTTLVPPTTTTAPPVTTTSPETTQRPPSSTTTTTRTSSSTLPPTPSRTPDGTTSSSSSSKVPIIVGSVAGVAVVTLVAAILFICYRRRRKRLNNELTFDTIEGIAGNRVSKHKSYNDPRQSIGLSSMAGAGGAGAVGAGSNVHGGYDYDDYAQAGYSNSGYHHNHQAPYGQEFGDEYGQHYGYDGGYPSVAQGYQKPSIFQEDHMAYSASPMSASIGGRAGYDQGILPEIMYNDGNAAVASEHYGGGYGNAGYQQQGWDQYQGDGSNYYQEDPSQYPPVSGAGYDQHDVTPHAFSEGVDPSTMAAAGAGATLAVGGSGSPNKRNSRDPQALPESPRVQQLRRGDLFGQESSEYARPSSRQGDYHDSTTVAGSSIAVDQQSPTLLSRSTGGSSSPRAMGREVRSFEMTRGSPGRSSNDYAPQSYAADYVKENSSMEQRPSVEGVGIGGGNGAGGLEPKKSLRSRRKDW